MYGIFPYIYHKSMPNVGKYPIHGSYGIYSSELIYSLQRLPFAYLRCGLSMLISTFPVFSSPRLDYYIRIRGSRSKTFICLFCWEGGSRPKVDRIPHEKKHHFLRVCSQNCWFCCFPWRITAKRICTGDTSVVGGKRYCITYKQLTMLVITMNYCEGGRPKIYPRHWPRGMFKDWQWWTYLLMIHFKPI